MANLVNVVVVMSHDLNCRTTMYQNYHKMMLLHHGALSTDLPHTTSISLCQCVSLSLCQSYAWWKYPRSQQSVDNCL